MAQATDANISKLQQMFPKVEGDVIAILLNDCENDVEKCINGLLVLSGESAPVSPHQPPNDIGHTHDQGLRENHRRGKNSVTPKRADKQNSWQETSTDNSPHSTSINSHKRSQHKLQGGYHDSSQSVRCQFPHGNKAHLSRPQGRGGNYGDRPHPYHDFHRTVVTQEERWRERDHQQGHFFPSGGARRPLLASPFPPPNPMGVIGPRGNFCHPPQQTKPNLQYYPSGRAFRGPPPLGGPIPYQQRPPYGINNDRSNNGLQPRIIVAGGIPVTHGGMPMEPPTRTHGGMLMGPGGIPVTHGGMPMEPPTGTHGGMLMGPGGIPVTHGGMPIEPPTCTHGGMLMGPGGIPVAHGSMPMEPSGTHGGLPVAHGVEPQRTSNAEQTLTNSQSRVLLTSPVSTHGLMAGGLGGMSPAILSDSHTPIQPDHQKTVDDDQGKVGWPIVTESESSTEHWNLTESSESTMIGTGTGNRQHGTEPDDGVDLELAGKEWEDGDRALTTEKKLVILRGLPGSGKSTLARKLVGKYGNICSTDDNFYVNGRYVFDRSKLGEYHEKNKEDAHQAMLIEISPVVIDNTNISAWEMKPYVELGQALGYEVEIMEPTTPWKFDCAELARRNSHGVSRDKIEKMLTRYDHNVTIDAILASQPPGRDRIPHGSIQRGSEMTSGRGRLTPAHSHYARRQPTATSKSSHHTPVSPFPGSSQPAPSISPAPTPNPATVPTLPPDSSSSSIRQSPLNSSASGRSGDILATDALKGSQVSSSTVVKGTPRQAPPQISESDSTTLIPRLTKEEEEERAAKMSLIWGDRSLSDNAGGSVLEELDKKTDGVGWSGKEGVWSEGGDFPFGTQKNEGTSLNRSQKSSPGGHSDSGLDSVGDGVGHQTVEENGLVARGHPLPCKFGPIGKPAKISSPLSVDSSGTTLQALVTDGQTEVDNATGNSSTLASIVKTENEFLPQISGSTRIKGKPSQERTRSPLDTNGITSPLPPHPSKNRSPSVELWVSEEMENWAHEASSEAIFVEEREGSDGESSSSSTNVPISFTPETPRKKGHHKEEMTGAEGVLSVDPSNYEQSGAAGVKSDSSFDDPAIVNMVKQSVPLAGLAVPLEHDILGTFYEWKEDFEPESQGPLFAVPSSETSPDAKHGSARAPSSRSSMSVSFPLPQPPPGVCSNVSVATEAPQSSAPTLLPTDEELIVEAVGEGVGVKDFFPSAFESDKDILMSVLHTAPTEHRKAGGEIPTTQNDIIVTSSESYKTEKWDLVSDNTNTRPLPVNCVSTTAASDSSRVKRNLWPLLGEKANASGEVCDEFALLEASASIQESHVDPGGCRPAPAGDSVAPQLQEGLLKGGEGSVEGVGSAEEVADPQSDLLFLVECFPDLSKQFLQLLLQQSQGNVEGAVSTALVSTVTSPTQPVLPHDVGDIFGLALAYDQVYQQVQGRLDVQTSSMNGSSAASVTSESDVEGGANGDLASEDDECMNDEEIARIMQEQLNLAESEEASLQAVERIVMQEREQRAEERRRKEEAQVTERALLGEVQEDDNLVLRLSRSLASQLQRMFGSVEKHLTVEGLLREEDLQVLLSERAAQQIWQKWVDTLEAKKAEIQLHQRTMISRVQSAPVLRSDTHSKPVAQSGTEPGQTSSFSHIMIEQAARETSSREVYKVVMAVCNETMTRKMKLRQLYGRFRSLDKDTINYILLKNNFNFSSAAQELQKEAARDESTDGNTTSQSSKSSVVHTAKKPARRGGKQGKPSRSARTPKNRRAMANKTGSTQIRRDDIVVEKSFQELEDRPLYDDLRAEAALHAKLRSEAFQKAAQARSLKQGDVAVFYAQQGHSHTERMKEANRRAADLILQLQNDLSSQYLDLHGLHVEEAISALQERLQTTTDNVLYVITGKGIHSKGEARLKPAVVQFLRSNNYTFEEQPGRFKVKL